MQKEWKRTALYNAIRNDNNEIIKLLLQNDEIDVNIPGKEWADWAGGGVRGEGTILKSPLYLSISKNNDEISKILLGYENLNVNFINGNFINRDNNENTIMMIMIILMMKKFISFGKQLLCIHLFLNVQLSLSAF